MEIPKIGRNADRFAIQHFPEIQAVAALLTVTFFATVLAIKDSVRRDATKYKNDTLRSKENRNIVPLNPEILKQANLIAESIF